MRDYLDLIKMKNNEEVEKLARKIISELKPFCKKIKIVGSIGRHEKKHVDIDIVLIPKDRKKLEDFMKTQGKFLQGGEHESTWKVKYEQKTGNFLTNSAPDLARAIDKKIYSLPRSRSPKRGRVKGIQIELYYTNEKEWGAELLAYSSSKGSAIGLRVIAKKKGLHLTQHGLFKGKKRIAGKTEKEIYRALGRKYKKLEDR